MPRIIKRAGVALWQKPFQNFRSTRETELAEIFPIHVVCKWMGNSEPIAAAHYLRATDTNLDRAASDERKAAHNAAQKMYEAAENGVKPKKDESSEVVSGSGDNADVRVSAYELWY